MLGNAAWSSLLNSDIGTRSQESNRYDFTGADRGIERRVAQPVTEAHQVLRENCLYGNVRAFGEIRFHAFGSGFVTIESIPPN
jgi:hypothetical protein